MRACWLKWVGRDWSISADYIWLNYSDANTSTRKVQRVAEKIGVSRLSKDQVSAIASSLDQASRICTEGRSRARQCPTSGSTRPTSRSPLFFEIVFRKIAKAISFQRRI